MNLHIHRNSFNAGELSPLMDARVDDAKHPFSCRILENFIPKVYGGAFRRPGSIYLGTAHDLAVWTEVTEFSRIVDFQTNADTPTTGDDTNDSFEVGSLWAVNSREIREATGVGEGAASWGSDLAASGTHNLYASAAPTEFDDNTAGYTVAADGAASIWFNQSTNTIYLCTDKTTNAAVWTAVSNTDFQHNFTATIDPDSDNDTTEGYAVGSYWITNTRSIYECSDASAGAAAWATVSGTHNLVSDRTPKGADNDDYSYGVGSLWVWPEEGRAWELTSLTGSQTVRLFDFNVSASLRYVIEMGDGYARFWNSDGTRFVDAFNSPYTDPLQVITPYSAAEIHDVQIAQLGNLAYFAHPDHPPQKLVRSFDATYAASTFTWSKVDWSYPAFRDINLSSVTATPSATTGRPVTIEFSANPFTETTNYNLYNGARIALTHRRTASSIKLDLVTGTSGTPTAALDVIGDYQVYTYGAYTGVLSLQFKDPAGTWQTLKTFEFKSEADRQIVYSSSTEELLSLRLVQTWTAGTAGTAYLEVADSRVTGYGKMLNGVTFVGGLARPEVEVETDFNAATATTEWAIESWAEYSGYPRAVAFHEQRLWFGGTELQPNTVWASATNDFENFRRGAFDGDSLAFTLAAQENSAVQSLLSHEALVIFTQSEEWTVSTSQQTAITPSNVFVRRQSRYGSTYRPAFVAANNLLFLDAGARKLRQFAYSATDGSQGQASDLSKYAEHVTISGVNQMAFQRHPDPILWGVTNDGVLLSFTFEPDENVLGWARHTSGSAIFESVITIYGSSSDEVWLVVNRGGERMLERFDSESYSKLELGTSDEMIYLDSAVYVANSSPSDTVSGLDHLEGETVGILADGAVQANRAVSSGSVTLDGDADKVVVGLPYTSTLQPSKIEVAAENGTSQGKTFLCKKVHLNLWKTYGLECSDGNSPASWFPVLGRNPETALGDPEPLFTGLAEITNQGRHKDSVDVTIRQTLPLPCNVLAMIPQIQISSD